MHPTLQKLSALDIPIHSFVAAIRHLSSRGDLSGPQYNNLLSNLTDTPINITDERLAKYTFLYFVQETIKKSFTTDKLNPIDIVNAVQPRAAAYIAEHEWIFAQPEEDDTPKFDSNGNVKRKRGAKQDEARELYLANQTKTRKEIIELFIDKLDMSKAGATTYYHNLKNQKL